jgi:hypothetical protein
MPTFLHNKKAFIHIPKTGGTSISSLFNNQEFFIQKYIDIIVDREHLSLLHASASLVKKHEECLNMVTFVRNPYHRFISAYCMGRFLRIHNFEITIEGIQSFCNEFQQSQELQKSLLFKPMVFYTHDENSKCMIDNILYFEDFQNEISKFCKFMDIYIERDIPHINKIPIMNKNNLEYDAWYQSCPMLYDFVNEVYAEDFKAFNYTMQYR